MALFPVLILAIGLSFQLASPAAAAENAQECARRVMSNTAVQNLYTRKDLCLASCSNSPYCSPIAMSSCMAQDQKCEKDSLGCRYLLGSFCTTPAPSPSWPTPGKGNTGNTDDDTCGTMVVHNGKCYCPQDSGHTSPFSAGERTDEQCKAQFPNKPTAPAPGTNPPPDPQTPPPQGGGSTNAGQQACTQAKTSAQSCCSNPTSCGAFSGNQGESNQKPGESIQQYCQRMQAAGWNTGNTNNNGGLICLNKINECNSQCGNNECDNLRSYVSQMGNQALNTFNASNVAQQCQQLTQQQQGQGGGGSPSPSGSPSSGSPSPMSQTAADRLAAEQSKAAAEAEAAKKATPGFEGFDDLDKGGFNVGNNSAGQTGYSGNGELNPAIAAIKGSGRQGTVANNSGGQIPGQGGNADGAKLAGRSGVPGLNGTSTDVMKGFQSAAAANTPGGSESKEEEGTFSGYGGRGPAEEDGLDLRQYLPGGRHDPGVRHGGLRPASAEINGPHVDVWVRITTRMQEKCRLGELIDCN